MNMRKTDYRFYFQLNCIVNRVLTGSYIIRVKSLKLIIILLLGCNSIQVQGGIFGSSKPESKAETKKEVKVETKATAAAKKKEINKGPVIAEEGSFNPFSDQKPEFPGGSGAMKKFIDENLKNPYSEEDIYGKVKYSFIVNLDGSLSNFELERSLGLSFDAEASRIIRLFPNWTVGKKKGIPVRAYCSAEIYFKHQKHIKPKKKSIKSYFKPITRSKLFSKIFKKSSRRMEKEEAD
jgi:hypothetical protein